MVSKEKLKEIVSSNREFILNEEVAFKINVFRVLISFNIFN